MKFIKLNNTQAKKISGKEDDFHANGSRFIDNDFFIVVLEDLMPIAKGLIKTMLSQGKATVIDMSKKTNADVIKIMSVLIETEAQGNARIATRSAKWDYTKMEVTEKL